MSRRIESYTARRMACIVGVVILFCVMGPRAGQAGPIQVTVPSADVPMAVTVELPAGADLDPTASWQLVEVGGTTRETIAAQLSMEPDRTAALCFVAPAGDGTARRFRLVKAEGASAAFRIEDAEGKHLRFFEGDDPVMTYNYATIEHPDVAENLWRSCYVHPIHGLDGRVITDDFPKDHRHHRGLFWTWARVIVGADEHDLWALSGCEQRFDKVLHQDAGPVCATLGVTNRWFVGEEPIVRERVWLRAFPAGDVGRAIDVDVTLEAIAGEVTISGRPEKGYGGMTLRFGPREDTVITTSDGGITEDKLRVPYKWTDLSARLGGVEKVSGAAMFDHPANPAYPNEWLLRHYGVLDCCWPSVELYTLKPGEPVRLRYRIWVHEGDVEGGKVAAAHDAFVKATEVEVR
jgi:hypothetical protein